MISVCECGVYACLRVCMWVWCVLVGRERDGVGVAVTSCSYRMASANTTFLKPRQDFVFSMCTMP